MSHLNYQTRFVDSAPDISYILFWESANVLHVVWYCACDFLLSRLANQCEISCGVSGSSVNHHGIREDVPAKICPTPGLTSDVHHNQADQVDNKPCNGLKQNRTVFTWVLVFT